MLQDHSFPVLTKCRITMYKNLFMLLLNDMKRKLLVCFYPLKGVVQYFILSVRSADFLHSSLDFSYCISMSFICVIFSNERNYERKYIDA